MKELTEAQVQFAEGEIARSAFALRKAENALWQTGNGGMNHTIMSVTFEDARTIKFALQLYIATQEEILKGGNKDDKD